MERSSRRNPQLPYEYKIYHFLRGGIGIPNAYYYNLEGCYNMLVMDLLGPSLEDLFNYCNRRFSFKTVCMLAQEMITRLEYIHSKNFIHRDIKPENFVVGLNQDANIIFLLDYGLSKRYCNPTTKAHIPYFFLLTVIIDIAKTRVLLVLLDMLLWPTTWVLSRVDETIWNLSDMF